jgi:hypothetical protein
MKSIWADKTAFPNALANCGQPDNGHPSLRWQYVSADRSDPSLTDHGIPGIERIHPIVKAIGLNLDYSMLFDKFSWV